MKLFVQLAGAGLVGFLALELFGWLVLPFLGAAAGLMGLAAGFFGLILKIGFVFLVGWLVLRLFGWRRRPAY